MANFAVKIYNHQKLAGGAWTMTPIDLDLNKHLTMGKNGWQAKQLEDQELQEHKQAVGYVESHLQKAFD